MKSHDAIRAFLTALLGVGLASQAVGPIQAGSPPEQGLASWYGGPFNGQRAASGEVFDQEQLTAAHRTLAFGTKVRVRRLDCARSIVVRINDRGPYVPSRIIDLSYAAARGLGMTDPGLVPVALEVIEAPAVGAQAVFVAQAGSFRNFENARRTRALLEMKYGAARIVSSPGDSALWRVLVGEPSTQNQAEALADAVRKSDKVYQSAFVVRLDFSAAAVAD